MQPEDDVTTSSPRQTDLTRTFLLILIIAVLIVGSVWTLLPFLSALVWATTIVVATWPLMLRVERRTGGRRRAAPRPWTQDALDLGTGES